MKKLIVAASALMLTGAMVSTAAAEVAFNGDAYTRYYMLDNMDITDSEDADSWRSRVRLRMKGTTASGAFAAARFEMDNDRWGDDDGGNVTVDYAYISVPVGCVNITAGDWDFNSGLAGMYNDIDVEAVGVTWSNDTTTVTGLYAINDTERAAVGATTGYGTLDADGDLTSDPDDAVTDGTYTTAARGITQAEDRIFAVVVNHNFDNAWNLTGGLAFVNTDVSGPQDQDGDDHTGIVAQIGASGQAGPVALGFEIGFQEDGLAGTDEAVIEATGDDGYGFFLSAGMDFDAVNVTFVGGMAQDGYTFDAPVGFIMIGGDSMLSPVDTIGSVDVGGLGEGAWDTWFAGFATSYQATEALGLGFNIAYADVDASDGSALDGNDGDLFEISGSLSYALADGVSVTSNVGWLDVDADDAYDEDTFGAVVSLNLTF